MHPIATRLVKCFELVLPNLSPDQIPAASQTRVPEWDSTTAIMLLNVIEDEFNIQVDFERVADLDSFSLILDYLTEVGVQ